MNKKNLIPLKALFDRDSAISYS